MDKPDFEKMARGMLRCHCGADEGFWTKHGLGCPGAYRQAAESALRDTYRAGMERAAQMTEAEFSGCQIDRFVFNGVTATNRHGHCEFISTAEATRVVLERAAAIRSEAASVGGGE